MRFGAACLCIAVALVLASSAIGLAVLMLGYGAGEVVAWMTTPNGQPMTLHAPSLPVKQPVSFCAGGSMRWVSALRG